MGVVYRAYDPDLNRKVALKFIRNPGHTSSANPNAQTINRGRLLQEAQFMAQLSHPNVVTIYDLGVFRTHIYIAMELIDGQTLGNWINKEGFGLRQALTLLQQAGQGLVAAHDAGLVHRDFKPDNVLLGNNGQVCVSDFGLVYQQSDGLKFPAPHISTIVESQKSPLSLQSTRQNIIGTPLYMSPEQHRGEPATHLSDQFSFCICLYEVAYGIRPFKGESRHEIADAITNGVFQVPPKHRRVPRWLSRVIRKGLSFEPQSRFPSMHALLAELEIHQESGLLSPWRIGSLSLLLALTIGLHEFWVNQRNDELRNCRLQSRTIDTIWNEDRRREIQNQFLASGLEYAGSAWNSVDRLLNQRFADWTRAIEETCNRSHRDQLSSNIEHDLQFNCLHTQREQLQTFVSLLAQADAKTIEKSVETAKAFSPIVHCQDAERLGDLMSLPQDPRVHTTVRGVRNDLNKADLYRSVGQLDKAHDLSRRIVRRAHEINYEPLLAEAYYALTWQSLDLFDNLGAQQWVQKALDYAESGKDDRLIFQIANLGIFIHGCRLEDSRETDAWIRHARAHLLRAGDSNLQRAEWLFKSGAAYGATGRLEESKTVLYRSLEIFRHQLGAEHPRTLKVYRNLAITLQLLRQYEEAERIHRQIVRMIESSQGTMHPSLVPSLFQLSAISSLKGDFETALAIAHRIIGIQEAVNGKNSMYAGKFYHLRAVLHYQMGHYRQAILDWQDLIRILENNETLPDVVRDSYSWMARSWTKLERFDLAKQSIQKLDLANWGPKNGRNWERGYLTAVALELAQNNIDQASSVFRTLLKLKHEESQINLLDPSIDRIGAFNLVAGNLALAQEHAQQALHHHQVALKLAQSHYIGETNPHLFPYVSAIAKSTAIAMRDYPQAATYMSKALLHLSNPSVESQHIPVDANLQLGEFLSKSGKWKQAHAVLIQAEHDHEPAITHKQQARIIELKRKIMLNCSRTCEFDTSYSSRK